MQRGQREEAETQELVGPQQYFVEVGSYKEATGTIPADTEVVQKSYLGRLISGVIVCGRRWHAMWEVDENQGNQGSEPRDRGDEPGV